MRRSAILPLSLLVLSCAPAPPPATTPAPATRAAADRARDLAVVLRAEDRRVDDEELRSRLASEDPVVRARAVRAVGRIGAPGCGERIEPALRDPDAGVRASAALAAGLAGDSAAVPALVRAADDPEAPVRARVAESLGRLGAREGAEAVARLLGDPDAGVRREAALAAWKLPDPSPVLVALGKALSDPSDDARAAAAYAVARLASAPWAPPSSGPAPARLDDPVVARLRASARLLARDPVAEVRMQVARALTRPSGVEEMQALEGLSLDSDPGVRIQAIRSLAFPGTAVDSLRRALSDSDRTVLRAAVEALGKIGGADAEKVLWDGVNSDKGRSPWILEAAFDSLARLRPDLVPEMAEGLAKRADPLLRATAARILAGSDSPKAAAIAAPLLEDRSPLVASAAVAVVARAPGLLSTTLAKPAASEDPVVRAAVAEGCGARLAKTGVSEEERQDAFALLARLWDAAGKDVLPDARVEVLSSAAKGGKDERGKALLERGIASGDRSTRLRAIAGLSSTWGEDRSSAAGPASDEPIGHYEAIVAWAREKRAAVVTVQRPRFEPARFTVSLDTDESPLAAWNFWALAEKGFYDGLVVHRVVPNFVVQDGDPRGDGWGGPGYAIRDEYGAAHYVSGTLGMASDGKDTAGSQWFVTLSAQPHLDGRYTAFGRVVQNFPGVVALILPGDRIVSIRPYVGDGSEPLPPLGAESPAAPRGS